MITNKLIRILSIEDNDQDYLLLKNTLKYGTNKINYELLRAEDLPKAFDCLSSKSADIDVCLLNMSFHGWKPEELIATFVEKYPEVPIVILAGLNDEELAQKILKLGAHDYLIKGTFNYELLIRTMRYAKDRHRWQLVTRSMSIIDDLTALYNRKGFLTIAEQQLRLLKRKKRGFLLYYIDIDSLRLVNEKHGKKEGDKLLIDFSGILKKTFRDSDVIGRLGGDEFIVFASDTDEDRISDINFRLDKAINEFNDTQLIDFEISITKGIVFGDPQKDERLEYLIELANEKMYEEKKKTYNNQINPVSP